MNVARAAANPPVPPGERVQQRPPTNQLVDQPNDRAHEQEDSPAVGWHCLQELHRPAQSLDGLNEQLPAGDDQLATGYEDIRPVRHRKEDAGQGDEERAAGAE